MILKCAQHISLSEHSHPPKLIKSYIAISCLIKATLCSENPPQLSNGCYSMKTDCIFLPDRKKIKNKTYFVPNGLQGIEPAKRCQDGEGSILCFTGDLCSSWKSCESQTARQIRLPYSWSQPSELAMTWVTWVTISVLADRYIPVGRANSRLLTLSTYFNSGTVTDL